MSHSMDEHKRNEMNKMDDMSGHIQHFGGQPALPGALYNHSRRLHCTRSGFSQNRDSSTHFDTALLEVKQQIQKGLHQYKYPPIPTRQEQIVVPTTACWYW